MDQLADKALGADIRQGNAAATAIDRQRDDLRPVSLTRNEIRSRFEADRLVREQRIDHRIVRTRDR